MRQDWASGTDRLLAKYDYFSRRLSPTVRRVSHKLTYFRDRDGKLITLIFPLGEFEGGPPFAMSYSLYRTLHARSYPS